MVEAWLVRYPHYGETLKFITLDKTRAIEYAMQHHGTYHALVEGLPAEVQSVTESE